MRELEQLYDDTRHRIGALLDDAGPAAAATPVPACPGWEVRDVVAHLTGLCADVIAANLDGMTTDAWTAAQVDARRARPFDDVLAEWADLGPKFAAMIDDFPGWYGRQVVADLTVHEHDLRGGLGTPGPRDGAGLHGSLDFLLVCIVEEGAAALGLEPLEVTAEDRSWVVGSGPPAARLAGTTYELFRAFTGRRSAAQISGLDWTGDAAAYLPLFQLGPFTMRTSDLVE